jgi:3'(2'), 5'-bisphosphate nucleotidase
MWTLDPIDGTKGFLRGGQYAVCLALLVDARVELGVIGCPNLPSTSTAPPPSSSTDAKTGTGTTPGDRGALFVAVRGHGTLQLPLLPGPSAITTRLSMPRLALHELSFLESIEKAHAALATNARVASRLGVRATPVRMDSQAKYAALTRGDGGGGVYLRLPVVGRLYEEKIWVRAASTCLSSLLIFRVCRTTPLGRSSSKRLAESSRILVGFRSTLASGARSVQILGSSRRGRRSMGRWLKPFRRCWRKRRRERIWNRFVHFRRSPL